MTSPMDATLGSALLPVHWPALPGRPAIDDERVRVPHARRDVYEADTWSLDALGLPPSVPRRTLIWARFPRSLRDTFRRAAYLLINVPTPAVVLTRPGSHAVEWPSPNSIRSIVMAEWLHFAAWMHKRGYTTLRQIDRAGLELYAKTLNQEGSPGRGRCGR